MRPFVGWPMWALRALEAALTLAGVMPGLLWRVQGEIWMREVVEWVEDVDGKRGWRCAPVDGVQ